MLFNVSSEARLAVHAAFAYENLLTAVKSAPGEWKKGAFDLLQRSLWDAAPAMREASQSGLVEYRHCLAFMVEYLASNPAPQTAESLSREVAQDLAEFEKAYSQIVRAKGGSYSFNERETVDSMHRSVRNLLTLLDRLRPA
jgi:hypothetical protein